MTINLTELEDALQGLAPGECYLMHKTARIVFINSDDMDEEDEESAVSEDEEPLPIDKIESRDTFRWMEEFIETVHSIGVQDALRDAIRRNKPFRRFKDALMEFPEVRQQWFDFEALRIRSEALNLLESLDFEILEIDEPKPEVP